MPEFASEVPRPTRPIICVDFDGVIHSYERGWDDGTIYGTVVPGFFEWLRAVSEDFKVVVYSARSIELAGRLAMRNWIRREAKKHYGYDTTVPVWVRELEYPNRKPRAYLTIDDRAIVFQGSWAVLDVAYLKAFKPWNQK